MYYAESDMANGHGVTKERAIAGVCAFHVKEGYMRESQVTFTVIEYRPRDFFGGEKVSSIIEPEEQDWARDVEEVTLEPDGIRRFAELHNKLEKQLKVTESEDDWRVDFGDEDITYVTKCESGGVVGIDEHWDEAKETLEEVREWPDGKDYWIDEVEGEVEFTLTEMD